MKHNRVGLSTEDSRQYDLIDELIGSPRTPASPQLDSIITRRKVARRQSFTAALRLEAPPPLTQVPHAKSVPPSPTMLHNSLSNRFDATMSTVPDLVSGLHYVAPQPSSLAASPVTPPYLPSRRNHNFFTVFVGDPLSASNNNDRSEGSMIAASADNNNTNNTNSNRDGSVSMETVVTLTSGTVVGQMQPVVFLNTSAGDSSMTAMIDIAAAAAGGGDEAEESIALNHSYSTAMAPPFSPDRQQQWNILALGVDPSLPLYTLDEVPRWQKYNPFLLTGYRAFYTTAMSWRSLFGWHNETINVWSHGIAFLTFLALTIVLFVTVLPTLMSAPTLRLSRLVYALFCLGCMLCMLNSTLYHLFTGHCSHKVTVAMGRMDFLGITSLIITSFLPPLYTMCHCYPVLRTVYIVLILLLGTAGIVGPWTTVFYEQLWLRTGVFLGMGFSGIIPSVHLLYILPTQTTVILGIALMVVLYVTGVIFYVTQFPESKYPGHFDTFLSSHQIWHFFVFAAAMVHYFNCVSMYQMWQLSDGAC